MFLFTKVSVRFKLFTECAYRPAGTHAHTHKCTHAHTMKHIGTQEDTRMCTCAKKKACTYTEQHMHTFTHMSRYNHAHKIQCTHLFSFFFPFWNWSKSHLHYLPLLLIRVGTHRQEHSGALFKFENKERSHSLCRLLKETQEWQDSRETIFHGQYL